jgi:hypothetical protein
MFAKLANIYNDINGLHLAMKMLSSPYVPFTYRWMVYYTRWPDLVINDPLIKSQYSDLPMNGSCIEEEIEKKKPPHGGPSSYLSFLAITLRRLMYASASCLKSME